MSAFIVKFNKRCSVCGREYIEDFITNLDAFDEDEDFLREIISMSEMIGDVCDECYASHHLDEFCKVLMSETFLEA